MPNNFSGSFEDKRADESSILGTKLSESMNQLKDKVSDLGPKAADSIDQNLDSAAGGLDRAAAALHGRAENLSGVNKLSGVAHSAADKLSATAEYVREHGVDRMMMDAKNLITKNPGPSLLAAGVLGFVLGRAFRSSNID